MRWCLCTQSSPATADLALIPGPAAQQHCKLRLMSGVAGKSLMYRAASDRATERSHALQEWRRLMPSGDHMIQPLRILQEQSQ